MAERSRSPDVNGPSAPLRDVAILDQQNGSLHPVAERSRSPDVNGPSAPLRVLAILHQQNGSLHPVAERSRSPDVNGPSAPLRNRSILFHPRGCSTHSVAERSRSPDVTTASAPESCHHLVEPASIAHQDERRRRGCILVEHEHYAVQTPFQDLRFRPRRVCCLHR